MKKLFYFLLVSLNCFAALGNIESSDDFNPKKVEQIKKIVHDYIINNPSVLVEASQKLQEQEEAKEKALIEKIKNNIPKYKKAIFDTKTSGRVFSGNPNGKVIIAEFTQYQCPHCIHVSPMIDKLLKENSDIQCITIYWPFFGDDAIYASKVALAAIKQHKFTDIHRALVEANSRLTRNKIDSILKTITGLDIKKLQADIGTKESDEAIKANFKLAQDIELTGTPAFIFADKNMTKFALVAGQSHDIEKDLNQALASVR